MLSTPGSLNVNERCIHFGPNYVTKCFWVKSINKLELNTDWKESSITFVGKIRDDSRFFKGTKDIQDGRLTEKNDGSCKRGPSVKVVQTHNCMVITQVAKVRSPRANTYLSDIFIWRTIGRSFEHWNPNTQRKKSGEKSYGNILLQLGETFDHRSLSWKRSQVFKLKALTTQKSR